MKHLLITATTCTCALLTAVQAFFPVPTHLSRTTSITTAAVSRLNSRHLLSKTAAKPSFGAWNHFHQPLYAAAAEGEKEGGKDPIDEELEHELPEKGEEEEDAPAPAAAANANPVDDVFNSLPFLTKRKEAMEKEMASIDENMEVLAQQYKELEGEWGDKLAFLKKDYDGLKARYYNDTQEVSMAGRSGVFVEIMSVVDDFERARMAYKPQTDEEKSIVEAYGGLQDAIIKGMMEQGLEEIKSVGEPFDFKMHDCMFTEHSDEYPEDVVTREFAKGFAIGGKVIRVAKVATSLGPSS